MAEKRRKSIAPQEEGQLPLEDRCPQCWRLLTLFEASPGNTVKWCMNCQYVKKIKE